MKNRFALKHILFIVLCGCLIITLVPQMKAVMELSERKAELLERKAELQERNMVLQSQLDSAGSLENIERLAREKLGMVKRGEQVLLAVPEYNYTDVTEH